MQNQLRSSAIAVMVGVCLLFPSVFFVSGRLWASSSLDPSFQMVLGYAVTHSLQFGRDIIFTYGPLGFITAWFGLGDLESARLVGGLLLAVTIVGAVARLAGGVRWPFVAVLFAWLITAPSSLDYTYQAFFFTIILVAGAAPSEPSPSTRTIIAAAVVLALLGLVKATFLFLSFPLIAFGFISLLGGSRTRLAVVWLSSYVLAFVAVWLACGQQPGAIYDYLQTSGEISSGYSEAMGRLPNVGVFVAVCGATAATVIGGLAQLRGGGATRWKRAHRTAVLTAVLFVAWKSGVVRADFFHLIPFLLLLPVLYFFAVKEFLQVGAPFQVMMRAGLGLAAAMALAVLGSDGRPLRRALKTPAVYAESLRGLLDARAPMMDPGTDSTIFGIDNRMRRLVGRAPIDVFGSRQGAALLNRMNYRPRPVFQSYSAYTPALQQANLDHYLGRSRPTFVLFDLKPIDNQFPTLEDAPLLIHLLGWYEPIGSSNGTLLLRMRAPGGRKPILTSLGRLELRFHQPLPLANYGNRRIVARIGVNLTLAGRLVAFVLRAPPINLKVTTADGRTGWYTFIPGMAKSGFLLSPLIQTNRDLYGLNLNPGTQALLEIQLVASYPQMFYRDPIRVELFELTL
jgi:hypothetical protein